MATPAATSARACARRRSLPVVGLGVIAVAALALGLLSLIGPAAPTYDPWAWIIWGREIVHLDLDTRLGPSWKPLPVAFTTAFAPLGSAAPALWVAVARAGGLAAIAMAYRAASRLGGGVVGGVLAAFALAVSTDFLRFAAVGDSEGLLVALGLAALELQLRGRSRAALWLAFAACLLRPEAWPFAGLFALWLARRDPSVRRLVAGMVVAGGALWFGPELWGSGDPLRAGARARTPNADALAFAAHPALAVAQRFARMLPLLAEAGVVALLASLVAPARAAGTRAARRGDRGARRPRLARDRRPDDRGGLLGQRPLPSSRRWPLACVAGGVGAGRALARLPVAPATLVALGLVLAVVLSLDHVRDLPSDARSARDEATLTARLHAALRAAGSDAAIRRCGTVTTGPFQVPVVAWALGVPLEGVGIDPSVPGTVARAGPSPSVPGAPTIPLTDRRWRPVAARDPWQVLSTCPLR